ncbi:MAG: hypothetical protein LBE16_02500, partial [Clostridiales Family XIII bacterium]|nr:hypothetical protein [Clostridiales Family XIII bacterium]
MAFAPIEKIKSFLQTLTVYAAEDTETPVSDEAGAAETPAEQKLNIKSVEDLFSEVDLSPPEGEVPAPHGETAPEPQSAGVLTEAAGSAGGETAPEMQSAEVLTEGEAPAREIAVAPDMDVSDEAGVVSDPENPDDNAAAPAAG